VALAVKPRMMLVLLTRSLGSIIIIFPAWGFRDAAAGDQIQYMRAVLPSLKVSLCHTARLALVQRARKELRHPLQHVMTPNQLAQTNAVHKQMCRSTTERTHKLCQQ